MFIYIRIFTLIFFYLYQFVKLRACNHKRAYEWMLTYCICMRARDVVIFFQSLISSECMLVWWYRSIYILSSYGADVADNAEHVTAIIFDCIASHVRVAGVVFTEHFVYLRTKLRCLHGAYVFLFLLLDCILDLFVQPCSVWITCYFGESSQFPGNSLHCNELNSAPW